MIVTLKRKREDSRNNKLRNLGARLNYKLKFKNHRVNKVACYLIPNTRRELSL
jgi:hypothetical protein